MRWFAGLAVVCFATPAAADSGLDDGRLSILDSWRLAQSVVGDALLAWHPQKGPGQDEVEVVSFGATGLRSVFLSPRPDPVTGEHVRTSTVNIEGRIDLAGEDWPFLTEAGPWGEVVARSDHQRMVHRFSFSGTPAHFLVELFDQDGVLLDRHGGVTELPAALPPPSDCVDFASALSAQVQTDVSRAVLDLQKGAEREIWWYPVVSMASYMAFYGTQMQCDHAAGRLTRSWTPAVITPTHISPSFQCGRAEDAASALETVLDGSPCPDMTVHWQVSAP